MFAKTRARCEARKAGPECADALVTVSAASHTQVARRESDECRDAQADGAMGLQQSRIDLRHVPRNIHEAIGLLRNEGGNVLHEIALVTFVDFRLR